MKSVLLASLLIFFLIYTTACAPATHSATKISEAQLKATNELLSQGEFEEAIHSYIKILEIEPKNFEAQFGLGKAYDANMQFDKAEEAFQLAQAIDPKNTSVLPELGNTLLNSGKDIEYNALVRLPEESHIDPKTKSVLAIDDKVSKYNSTKVGDIVYWGLYEQDNNTSNGKEAIAWKVLAVNDGKALLIAEKNLDCMPYEIESENATWETCSLRAWLNTEFLDTAFTKNEQKEISLTYLKNDVNQEFDAVGGRDTQDKIFLLSLNELNIWYRNQTERRSENSSYAVAQGVYNDNGYGWWWLRSPGCIPDYALCVDYSGSVDELFGEYIRCVDCAIRPALWVIQKP